MAITLKEFIAKHQIEMDALRVAHRTDGLMDEAGQRHWLCTLKQVGVGNPKVYSLFFSQGSAHTKPPKAEEVLDCIASDTATLVNARGFEEWASELGYDPDSRKAERIYHACLNQKRDFEAFAGWQVPCLSK